MKLKLTFCVSICLNIVLLTVWTFRTPSPGSSKGEAVEFGLSAVSPDTPRTERPVPGSTVSNLMPSRIDWRAVESEDYAKYIANLRAIGCPEETIRDIIIADVNKLFESRRNALKKPGDEFKFWKAGQAAVRGLDEKQLNQQQQLARHKREVLSELLGTDVEASREAAPSLNPLGDMLDFLPSAKQSRVMDIQQEFSAAVAKLVQPGGVLNPEEAGMIREAMAAKDAALNNILTPAEREQLDLTLSDTAMSMRASLAAFNPSEQEFRAIFKLEKKFDDEFAFAGGKAGAATLERMETARLETDRQLQQLLGNERFTDYRNERDWNSSPLREAAEVENVPKAAAVQVLDIRDLAQAQARQVGSDTSLSEAQRQAALQNIQNETRSAILATLGQKAAEIYLNNPTVSKGWLGSLNPVSTR